MIETLYHHHRNMIYKIAWSFHKTTGIDFKELESESNWLFVRAAGKWDGRRKKAKFSTYLYRVLTNGLIRFVNKWGKFHPPEEVIESYEILIKGCDKETRILSKLSDEGKEVAQMLLNIPSETLEIISPRKIRGDLRRELRFQGWSFPLINKTISEIREVLKNP